MQKKAVVTVHPAYRIAPVDKRLFGAFLEPIGNWVYGGIWNPDHPQADEMGFRKDILAAIREFNMPAVRLPGGNFTSGWNWEDSIGPKEKRKTVLDLAWREFESNLVGHDEYLQWAQRAGAEAMYTINMGTADINSAVRCIEYTNLPGGTYMSDLRKNNGYAQPYGVKTWYLGNEMDGPWQIGSWEKDPRGYGIKCNEVSKAMKWVDPSISTIISGTSMFRNASYPQWDLDVLEQCYENVDYLSLHYYHVVPESNMAAFVNGSSVFEEMIKTEIGACDIIKAKTRSPRTIMISFDEYSNTFGTPGRLAPGRPGYIPPDNYGEFEPKALNRGFRDPMAEKRPGRPRSGEILRALGSASILMTFLRYADRVKIGCMTSGIRGAIAFDDEHVWKSGQYHTYDLLHRYSRGTSLMPIVDGPTFNVDGFRLSERFQTPEYENVQFIEAAAAINDEDGTAAIFILNRNWENAIEVEIDARGFDGYAFDGLIQVHSADINAYNTYENQTAIYPVERTDVALDGGRITFGAKELSFNVIKLRKKI